MVEEGQQHIIHLKWGTHQTELFGCLISLIEEEKFVDVTLAAEGRHINAHKWVLSACSPYFEKLLLSQEFENQPIIYLKDMQFEVLLALVYYMYKGEVSVPEEHLEGFIAAAGDLQIKGLTCGRDQRGKEVSVAVSQPDDRGELTRSQLLADDGAESTASESVSIVELPAEWPAPALARLGYDTEPSQRIQSEADRRNLADSSDCSVRSLEAMRNNLLTMSAFLQLKELFEARQNSGDGSPSAPLDLSIGDREEEQEIEDYTSSYGDGARPLNDEDHSFVKSLMPGYWVNTVNSTEENLLFYAHPSTSWDINGSWQPPTSTSAHEGVESKLQKRQRQFDTKHQHSLTESKAKQGRVFRRCQQLRPSVKVPVVASPSKPAPPVKPSYDLRHIKREQERREIMATLFRELDALIMPNYSRPRPKNRVLQHATEVCKELQIRSRELSASYDAAKKENEALYEKWKRLSSAQLLVEVSLDQTDPEQVRVETLVRQWMQNVQEDSVEVDVGNIEDGYDA